MNYIRRILTNRQTALRKGDHDQIAHLLQAANFDRTNPQHVLQLRNLVRNTFNPENVPLAEGILHGILFPRDEAQPMDVQQEPQPMDVEHEPQPMDVA